MGIFKEYEVVYRAKIMVTSASEKDAIDRLHYLMSSVAEGIDGLLVGQWQTETLPKEMLNETNDHSSIDADR